jgi:hypothetical protein
LHFNDWIAGSTEIETLGPVEPLHWKNCLYFNVLFARAKLAMRGQFVSRSNGRIPYAQNRDMDVRA